MKSTNLSRLLALGGICLLSVAAQAQTVVAGATTTSATTTTVTTLPSSATVALPTAPSMAASPAGKQLVLRYTALAGSSQNAQSLILGLRYGEPVTLTGASGQSVTLMPPGRPMGWGNVNHALSLAKADLAANGITQPTSDQLRTALLGGSLTTAHGTTVQTQGILTLRSQGMGWGQVAHRVGVSPAMSGSHGVMAANGAPLGGHRDGYRHESGREFSHGSREQHHVRVEQGSPSGGFRTSSISTAAGASSAPALHQHHGVQVVSAAGNSAGTTGATASAGVTTAAGSLSAGAAAGTMGKASFAGDGNHGGGEGHGHFH